MGRGSRGTHAARTLEPYGALWSLITWSSPRAISYSNDTVLGLVADDISSGLTTSTSSFAPANYDHSEHNYRQFGCTNLELQGPQSPRRDLGVRFQPLRIREITALVMPANGVTNGPCNNNPSYITACLGDTAALTLSCVPPGQDKGVANLGRSKRL